MKLEEYRDPKKKFRTLRRDSMYFPIRDNDNTGIFGQMSSIFMMSFAIGFHRGLRKSVEGSGSINHVNISSIDIDTQDMIIMMILDRHPEISSPNQKDDVWTLVEQYAEGGIEVLYESLRLSEWVLDVESLIDRSRE